MSFRSTLSPVLAVLTLTAAIPSLSYAGAGSGGGGDPRCSEYSNVMGNIIKALALAGQDKINSVNPLIRLDDLIKIKQNLKCLPVEELDREARSYPADGHTDLVVDEWEKQGLYEKVNLTAHELSVLAGYENDGEYFVSEDIVKIVRDSSQKMNNLMSAEQVIDNPDGSVTLIRPFAVIEGKKTYFATETRTTTGYFLFVTIGSSKSSWTNPEYKAQGICKFLRYQEKIAYSQYEASYNRYADIDANGHLLGSVKKSGLDVHAVLIVANEFETSTINAFQSVTCK